MTMETAAHAIIQMITLPENYTTADQYRDFRDTFGTDAGKRVLARILRETGLFNSIYIDVGGEYRRLDAEEVLCEAAKREVGLWIYTTLGVEPRDWNEVIGP